MSQKRKRGTFLTYFLTAQQSSSSIFSSILNKSVTSEVEVLEEYLNDTLTISQVTPNESDSKRLHNLKSISMDFKESQELNKSLVYGTKSCVTLCAAQGGTR